MEDHCHFFVKKKKRYCRMTVKSGNKYCGEHLGSESYIAREKIVDNERVLCPLDSTHSCYKSKLSKHLRICNARKSEKLEPHIVKGYNVGEERISTAQIPLSQISESMITTIIEKINIAFESIPPITEEFLSHDILKKELQNSKYGNVSRKHLLQTSSLLAHLEHANLLFDDTCFIDFGAGKGKLTYWLAQVIKDQKKSSILLIDRSSLRHKSDNKLKNEQCPLNVKRIRVDIADLKLINLPEFKNGPRKVGLAKHLCGAATDLTLRCLINAMQDESQPQINGLLIAFCCHHRCNYDSYIGKDYLTRCSFSTLEFPILCSIATWATCGFKKGEDGIGNERENIGRKVKTLLNWGRLEFLRKFDFECRLVNYVSMDVSLENTCIIAMKN